MLANRLRMVNLAIVRDFLCKIDMLMVTRIEPTPRNIRNLHEVVAVLRSRVKKRHKLALGEFVHRGRAHDQ